MDFIYNIPPFVWVIVMAVVSLLTLYILRKESQKQRDWREQKLAKMEQTRMRIAAKKRAEAEAQAQTKDKAAQNNANI